MSEGLKKLIKGHGVKKLERKYHCENCKCTRYNPCKCAKSRDKDDTDE